MDQSTDYYETIAAGETASIENVQSAALAISLIGNNGSHLEFDLMPGQVVGLRAGTDEVRIILHHGDPAGLLVIKPESAS